MRRSNYRGVYPTRIRAFWKVPKIVMVLAKSKSPYRVQTNDGTTYILNVKPGDREPTLGEDVSNFNVEKT